jgi:ribonuclease-3
MSTDEAEQLVGLPREAVDAASALEATVGRRLTDSELLAQALLHRSYAFEVGGGVTNERLEFLGDAVVGLVMTDELYRRLPDSDEGRLSKLRASLVSTSSLAAAGRLLALGDRVMLGRGEEASGGRDKDSILADTMEAVCGAVYLGAGHDAADRLIRQTFDELVTDVIQHRGSLDYKTSLQELVAADSPERPDYRVSEEGPAHDKRFTAVVCVGGESLGKGSGNSKKEAEQAAAREAYTQLSDGEE